jgi:hypothetical protein
MRCDAAAGLAVVALLAAGCSRGPREFGCDVGATAPLPLKSVAAGRAAADELVAVEGTLEEICPTAGCWAWIGDGGATLRLEFVDFTLGQECRGSRCRAVGKLKSGADPPALMVRGLKLLP